MVDCTNCCLPNLHAVLYLTPRKLTVLGRRPQLGRPGKVMGSTCSIGSAFRIQFSILVLALSCGVAAARAPSGAQQPSGSEAGLEVPAGTILPARLNRGFSSKTAHVGQAISARVMQDVPLPGGGKIPAGAKLVGAIVSVSRAQPGNRQGGSISFRFSEVQHGRQRGRITANLRALGSLLEVMEAQLPETPAGFGTPYNWVTTNLIGGDVKYGVGGPVTDRGSQSVGVGTADGVLVHARPNADGGCQGEPAGSERLQALWLFSADACGVYGTPQLQIVHAGRTAPVGEVMLAAEAGDVNLRAGTGLLLRVR
jgi:hypothetical protein